MYDAIIVGGGPGGATAATLMAEAGLRVALVEKNRFPRDKICGDAVGGKSLGVIKRLGVIDGLRGLDSQASWGITFGAPSGETIAIPFSKTPDASLPAFVVPRQQFDQLLLSRAARAGAEILQQTTVDDLLWEAGQIAGVKIQNGASKVHRLCAPLVVGADGAYSVVARRLGMTQLRPKYYAGAVRAYYEGVGGFGARHFMEIHFLKDYLPGYLWIFSLGDGRANVGVGMLSADIKRRGIRLKSLLDACLAHPRFRERFAGARRVGPVKGWGLPLGSRPRTMAGAGWLLVGDAASLVDPFTGEGIGNAMIGGVKAAAWAENAHAAADFSAALLEGFERDVMAMIRTELRVSSGLQRLMRHRRLLDFTVRRANRSEELADLMTSMFDDENLRRHLLSPLFYLRLLAA